MAREDEPVSDFVRMLIARAKADGLTYKALAAKAGLAQSMISQIMNGSSGATFATAGKLARHLGYSGVPQLVSAAYAWHHAGRAEAMLAEPLHAREEAIALALDYGVTQEQIDRALTRYPGDTFASRDALWWLSRFHEERSLDAEISGLERAKDRLEVREAAQEKKTAQQKWRGRRKPETTASSEATPVARTRRVSVG